MGGGLGFELSRKGRTRGATDAVRVGEEGARASGDRRWSWMGAVEGAPDGSGGRGNRRC